MKKKHYLHSTTYEYCYIITVISLILSVIHAQYVDVKFVELLTKEC